MAAGEPVPTNATPPYALRHMMRYPSEAVQRTPPTLEKARTTPSGGPGSGEIVQPTTSVGVLSRVRYADASIVPAPAYVHESERQAGKGAVEAVVEADAVVVGAAQMAGDLELRAVMTDCVGDTE